ncbi:hypothetical protein VZC37_22520 [Gordonia sp. LSe1-13]|uniref:Secreted protein n=1 Tax=Gordonia sesuvii TaxID=3116777 RepID=A0ABU7MJ59_9ACTN|nr:hypothetical protein [Gordonia sp. LSe1-13]
MSAAGVTRTQMGAGVVAALTIGLLAGAGEAHAGVNDCDVRWNALGASAVCHDTGAPQGREYVLIVECWGLHGVPNRFPLYTVGPYTQSSRWFVPTGQASGNCSTSWGAPSFNAGVVTGAHVEIYRQ